MKSVVLRASRGLRNSSGTGRHLFMQIQTSRFGSVEIDADDILVFPRGLFAFEGCRHWVLLADSHSELLGWLQCATLGSLALPVVSPRRYRPDYKVHVARHQLTPLEFSQFDQAYVLSILSKEDGQWTLNLKAPLVINLDRRLGRQLITGDDQPIAWPLPNLRHTSLRKSA
jgi:flagellar assembly factor FliW